MSEPSTNVRNMLTLILGWVRRHTTGVGQGVVAGVIVWVLLFGSGAAISWILDTGMTFWIAASIVLLTVLCATLGLTIYRCRKPESQFLQAFIEMDDFLLQSMVSAHAEPSHDSRWLISGLLREFCRVVGRDLNRGMVLVPSSDDRHVLVAYASHGIPSETLRRARFYIGPSPSTTTPPRGVAGHAFVTSSIQIAHITDTKPRSESDHGAYHEFDTTRPHPPYHTLAAIPVRLSKDDSCEGVLCLDSMNPVLFDDPSTIALLEQFGARIAAVLSMFYYTSSEEQQADQIEGGSRGKK